MVSPNAAHEEGVLEADSKKIQAIPALCGRSSLTLFLLDLLALLFVSCSTHRPYKGSGPELFWVGSSRDAFRLRKGKRSRPASIILNQRNDTIPKADAYRL